MGIGRKHKLDCDAILAAYADTVYKIAISQLKNEDDAKDIFQEVFLKLVKCEKSFESDEHIKAWLIRVTINCCKDFYRNSYQANKRELVVEIPIEDTQHHEVYYFVQELEHKYKTVIHLFYYEQYSIREIAELLEEKEPTIKTRLSRAKEQLRKRMGRENDVG